MFVYAALGDSITYGQNAGSAEKAYPSLIISMLNGKGVPAEKRVLARPGWTSFDLSAALHRQPEVVRHANAVSVWIGGDDLVATGLQLLQGQGSPLQTVIHRFEGRLGSMLSFIQGKGAKKIICCTQYNPFPNSPIAVKSVDSLNKSIIRSASAFGCLLARPDQWVSGKEPQLIDGYKSGRIEEVFLGGTASVHPNEHGHSVIAAGLFPLVSPK